MIRINAVVAPIFMFCGQFELNELPSLVDNSPKIPPVSLILDYRFHLRTTVKTEELWMIPIGNSNG